MYVTGVLQARLSIVSETEGFIRCGCPLVQLGEIT
jgi:hypothetical protein